MTRYTTNSKGERVYISDNNLANDISSQSRKYSTKAIEKHKEAEQKMNQYARQIKSKSYKNSREIHGIEKLRQDALKLYGESKDYLEKASESESQIATVLAQSDPTKRIKTVVHRHEGNSISYLENAKDVENKIKRIIKGTRLGREDMGKLEEIADESPTLFFPILAMLAFFFALISSSFSITGFIISDTTNSVANYVTLICFIVGLVVAIIYLRKIVKDKMKEEAKKKKVKSKKKTSHKKAKKKK